MLCVRVFKKVVIYLSVPLQPFLATILMSYTALQSAPKKKKELILLFGASTAKEKKPRRQTKKKPTFCSTTKMQSTNYNMDFWLSTVWRDGYFAMGAVC